MTAHEIPGMVEHSAEAYAAGAATGMRRWRASFPFEVKVEFLSCTLAEAEGKAGPECLMLEDLNAAEVV